MTLHQNLIAELDVAISHGPTGRRAEALRAVTELFVGNAAAYNDEQVALFGEVIARLAAEIEVAARAALARRLAPINNAPRKVILQLAFDDEIDVAKPVLVDSDVLDDGALVDNARCKGHAHLLAISQRKRLATAVTEILVQRGDEAVVVSTVGNPGARFSDAGFAILVRRSAGNDLIASRVGTRQDIPRHLFLRLLATASLGVREKLESEKRRAAGDIRSVVRTVTETLQNRTLADSRDYAQAQDLVGRLQREHRFDEGRVGGFAATGNFEATVVGLAVSASLPLDFVERAMVQERSELLLIVCKAVGLSWTATKSVLQLRNRGLVVPAQELEQHLASFERLKAATARQVVRFHQVNSRRAPA